MSQSAFSSPPVHSLLRHIHLCKITDHGRVINFYFAVGNGNKHPIKLFYPVYFFHFNFFFSCCNSIFSFLLVTASVMTHFLRGITRRSSSQIWCYAHLIDLNLHVISNSFVFLFLLLSLSKPSLQMSSWPHDPGEWHQKVLCLHPLCYTALSPGDLCGPVAVQIHLPLPRRLQGTPLRDDTGHLPGGRGPELQLPLCHLYLLHGLTR